MTDSMTEHERLAQRRYQAYFAFEMDPNWRPVCGSLMPGRADHLLHRCTLPTHDGPHSAPVTLNPSTVFAGLRISWHNPLAATDSEP